MPEASIATEVPDTYDPEGDAPARVYVDGERIPVVNDGVTVRARKQGPLARTAIAEVVFPAETSISWESFVQQGDPARVEMRDHSADDAWKTVLNGYISAVGAGGSTSNDMQFRAKGPSTLLDSIPASKKFSGNATTRDILRYIVETFAREQPYFDADDIELAANTEGVHIDTVDGILQIFDALTDWSENNLDFFEETIDQPKTFRENRHTLKDITDWVMKHTPAKIWFEPQEEMIRFAVAELPTVAEKRATDIGGSVDVLRNNALAQLNPVNRVKVVGKQNAEIDLGVAEIPVPGTGGQYPVAVAEAPELQAAAGGQLTQVVDGEATTESAAESEARSALKDAVGRPSSESIVTRLTPTLMPYSVLSSPAVVKDQQQSSRVFDYEIEEAIHRAKATDTAVRSWSEFYVSLTVTDIKVDSWTETAGKEREDVEETFEALEDNPSV